MADQRKTYVALVAAMRQEFQAPALEALWIQMREHRYNTSSLGILAQAVHDAHDVTYDTGKPAAALVGGGRGDNFHDSVCTGPGVPAGFTCSHPSHLGEGGGDRPATPDEIRARVTAALTAPGFGPTADDVADRLRALEIKGRHKGSLCCPIAVYLNRDPELGGVDFEVGIYKAFLLIDGDHEVTVDLPEPVSWFVQRFDAGVYLDLVTPGGGA